jgi:hypothetical protein
MFRPDGMLSWVHVKREYVMKCIDLENDVKNPRMPRERAQGWALQRWIVSTGRGKFSFVPCNGKLFSHNCLLLIDMFWFLLCTVLSA